MVENARRKRRPQVPIARRFVSKILRKNRALFRSVVVVFFFFVNFTDFSFLFFFFSLSPFRFTLPWMSVARTANAEG